MATDDRIRKFAGVHFDTTISVGHILVFAAWLAAAASAWVTMDKRVTVLEHESVVHERRDDAQDAYVRERLEGVGKSLENIQRGIDRLNERFDSTRDRK